MNEAVFDMDRAAANKPENERDVSQFVQPMFQAAAFGEIISVLMRSPAHRALRLDDLGCRVLPPFLLKQYAIAKAKGTDGGAPVPVGVVFWACVSEEVDHCLRSQLDKAIRLEPDAWHSGGIVWIVELVAPRSVALALISDVQKRIAPGQPIHLRAADADGHYTVQTIASSAKAESV